MTYTTMVYKAPSGQWSWSVLDDDRTPISSGGGYASEAEAEAEADVELAAHLDAVKPAHVVSVAIPPEFAAHCVAHGLSPGQVLTAFMADLGETSQSNGSDERMRAAEWFDRVCWPEADDELAMDWERFPRLRADGEVLTGIDALDYPPDIAHPGNVDPDTPC